jgi:hypothetical protein
MRADAQHDLEVKTAQAGGRMLLLLLLAWADDETGTIRPVVLCCGGEGRLVREKAGAGSFTDCIGMVAASL